MHNDHIILFKEDYRGLSEKEKGIKQKNKNKGLTALHNMKNLTLSGVG